MLSQLTQIKSKLQSTLVTLRGIFRHGAGDYGIQFGRKVRIKRGRPEGIAVGDLEANRGGTVPLERTVARNHVVENCTQRKQVGALVELFTLQLLGRHISRY